MSVEERLSNLENNKAGCLAVLFITCGLWILIADLGTRVQRLEKAEESRTQKSESKEKP